MGEPLKDDLRKRLEERLGTIRRDAQVKFESLIAHADDRDPHQRALLEPEVNKLLDEMRRQVFDALAEESLHSAVQQIAPELERLLDFPAAATLPKRGA